MKLIKLLFTAALLSLPLNAIANDQACTQSPGYWKTHSEFGPAPYDETWAVWLGGADTGFYGPFQTFYEVLHTSPKGNPYYILAHQWIAAMNNFEAIGWLVMPQEVIDALNLGNDLFVAFDPDEVTSDERFLFLGAAYVLEDYNSGVIGPGACSD